MSVEDFIIRSFRYGDCEHANVTHSYDTNEHGTMVVLQCLDCGLTMYVHPKQAEEYEKHAEEQ